MAIGKLSGTAKPVPGLHTLSAPLYPWEIQPIKVEPIPDSNSALKPSHYASPIDPYAYALANDLGFLESNVVKYVTRWKKKNGVEDLRKALETLTRLIDWVEKK